MKWIEPESRSVDDEAAETFATLTACGQALAEGRELRAALTSALQALLRQRATAVTGGVILLFDEKPSKATLHIAKGSWTGQSRGAGPLSEAMQRVGDTGRAAIEPCLTRPTGDSKAPDALSRVIVPITLSDRVIGLLGLQYVYDPKRDLRRSVSQLGVLAAMIAQAVAAQRRMESTVGDVGVGLTMPARDHRFSRLVGTSEPLGQVHVQVAQVAPSNTTVLIRGESGTGKSLIAQAIHHHSPRARKAFVTVSSAALPPDLVESELFGYEKGAFTGAAAVKKGRFELANGAPCFSTKWPS